MPQPSSEEYNWRQKAYAYKIENDMLRNQLAKLVAAVEAMEADHPSEARARAAVEELDRQLKVSRRYLDVARKRAVSPETPSDDDEGRC